MASRNKEKTGLERAANTEHVLVDVGTVSGAVTGAVAGIVAGPAGMIVGGAIGAALGTAAGAVLDRESHREELHDRVLDEEIGVTGGEIGVSAEAKAALDAPAKRAEAHRREIEAALEEEKK